MLPDAVPVIAFPASSVIVTLHGVFCKIPSSPYIETATSKFVPVVVEVVEGVTIIKLALFVIVYVDEDTPGSIPVEAATKLKVPWLKIYNGENVTCPPEAVLTTVPEIFPPGDKDNSMLGVLTDSRVAPVLSKTLTVTENDVELVDDYIKITAAKVVESITNNLFVTVKARLLLVTELHDVERDIDPTVLKYIVIEPVPPVAENAAVV